MNIFRLKFAFKRDNEDGAVEKAKVEIFAECDTYTEAEQIALEVIARDDMSKIELCDYEIVKTKFNAHDIIGNKALKYNEGELFCGKIDHYFSGDEDAFYTVNVKIITVDDKGKEHRSPLACLVSGTSISDAINATKKLMDKGLTDYKIDGAKVDAADSLLLTPDSHTEVIERI